MYFDDKFFKSLPKEPNAVITAICNMFLYLWDKGDIITQDPVLEVFALISAYSEANNLKIEIPQITTDIAASLNKAHQFVSELRKEFEPKALSNQFEQYENFFATKLGTVFHYEFSEGDLKLIQKLIDELRKLISTTKELEEDHKHRLINKLEKVQAELNKRVSNLDRFWGFCIDLSIVVGMMGKNAEPAANLVKKIVDIIWPAQTRAYELPSTLPFKLLGQAEDDKSEGDKS